MKIFKNLVVSVACVVGAMEIGIVNAADAGNLKRSNSTPSINGTNVRQGLRRTKSMPSINLLVQDRAQKQARQRFDKARKMMGHEIEAQTPGWPWAISSQFPALNPFSDPNTEKVMCAMKNYESFMRERNKDYPFCGNLLYCKVDSEVAPVILQSGLDKKAALHLQVQLNGTPSGEIQVPPGVNSPGIDTVVWGGSDVIAKVYNQVNHNNIINEDTFTIWIKSIAFNNFRNINKDNINEVINALLSYVRETQYSLHTSHNQRAIDYMKIANEEYGVTFDCVCHVGMMEGMTLAQTLLASLVINDRDDKADKKKDAVSRILNHLILKQGFVPEKFVEDMYNPWEETFNKEEQVNKMRKAISWLRYALHTEIQLSVLISTGVVSLSANEPILSLLEPCPSCEAGAPFNIWIDNEHRFISSATDNQRHLPTVTGLQQYSFQPHNDQPSRRYLTIQTTE